MAYKKKLASKKPPAAGVSQQKLFITPDSSFATYPVVSSLNHTSSLIAYTQKKGDKNYIDYQTERL